jgi:hypothetical protein
MDKLTFGHGNAKLDEAIYTFSLPAGWTCPFAEACLSRADRVTGRIWDGEKTEFRCHEASAERHTSVRKSRWRNLELLKGKCKDVMVELILFSLSVYAGIVRIHVSGDFFSQLYFDAWMEVARRRPHTRFYAYTKALPFWVRRLGQLPSNVSLTASLGGTHDHLVWEFGLKYAKVVYSKAEAQLEGLPIDHDDSHAIDPQGGPFALLLHGTQPMGSEASKAVYRLRSEGWYGYGESRRVALATV